MLFDSHTHLLDNKFDHDRDDIIAGLSQNGIEAVLECGTDMAVSNAAADLASAHDNVYAAVGVHPHDAKEFKDGDLITLTDFLKRPRVVAIGEIGLDYHYDFSPRDVQKRVFGAQMELARQLGVPVIIHSREATSDTLDILRAFPEVTGVWHSFAGSKDTLFKALDLGYYAAFGGPVTFKNAKKPIESAAAVPIDRLLIETDCPYLTPVPHRGKRNEPKYARITMQETARLKNIDADELEAAATRNAYKIIRNEE